MGGGWWRTSQKHLNQHKRMANEWPNQHKRMSKLGRIYFEELYSDTPKLNKCPLLIFYQKIYRKYVDVYLKIGTLVISWKKFTIDY